MKLGKGAHLTSGGAGRPQILATFVSEALGGACDNEETLGNLWLCASAEEKKVNRCEQVALCFSSSVALQQSALSQTCCVPVLPCC